MTKLIKKIEVEVTEPIIASIIGLRGLGSTLYLVGGSEYNPISGNNIILNLAKIKIINLPYKKHNYGYKNNKTIETLNFSYE